MKVFVCNGWAAEPSAWQGCAFARERIFDYLEQLDGVPARVLADEPAFVLVGFSMGGTNALRLLLSLPERVRGLVLVSATARMMADPATDWAGMTLRRREALRYGTRLMNAGNPSPLFAERNLDRGLDFLRDTDIRAELLRLSAASAHVRTLPVEILQGMRDGIVRPANADFLQRVFPQAHVTRLDGLEHALPQLAPGRIDEAVRAVLYRIGGSR